MTKKEIQLTNEVREAITLGLFRTFCQKNSTADARHRLRNIYGYTNDPIETTKNIFINEFDEYISDTDAERLFVLITSFLKKSVYRKTIADSLRKSLLQSQSHHCAICGCDIDIHAHADHIIPFKLVGDELDDNLQMLCADCNLKKSESLDYQIRFLLKLTETGGS